jgi:hypothetical protein
MTEADWLAGVDPRPMWNYVRASASRRKRTLINCACAWHLLPWATDPCVRQAIERAERYADGGLADSTLWKWANRVQRICNAVLEAPGRDPKAWSAAYVASVACHPPEWGSVSWVGLENHSREFGQADIFPPGWLGEAKRTGGIVLRDVLGNPFQPVAIDPQWRTADVLALARGIYEDRAFDRLPLLADALMDAGCDEEQLLAHCRSEGPHVRGCWVVDLVLAKE